MRVMHRGEVIAAAREKQGWSQAELARRVDVTASTINRIEAGAVTTTATLERIMTALDLTYGDFDNEVAGK